jgi:hypothetical protein
MKISSRESATRGGFITQVALIRQYFVDESCRRRRLLLMASEREFFLPGAIGCWPTWLLSGISMLHALSKRNQPLDFVAVRLFIQPA